MSLTYANRASLPLAQHGQLRYLVHPATDAHHDHVHADISGAVAHEPPRLVPLYGYLSDDHGGRGQAETQGPATEAGSAVPALQWPFVRPAEHDRDSLERGHRRRTSEWRSLIISVGIKVK